MADTDIENVFHTVVAVDVADTAIERATTQPSASKHTHSVRVDFHNITLEVNAKTGTKKILDKVSGYALPGEVLFIMGPSGAGKTSLLDSLSGRTKVKPQGDMFLDGRPISEILLKASSQYCTQDILLYEAMTVKETLTTAASFFTSDSADVEQRVTDALAMLGLQDQADTKVCTYA